MATQGLVTIKIKERVVMKVVAGCNGSKAKKVARQLRKVWPITIEEAYQLALKNSFGCVECLVVITTSNIKFEGDDKVSRLYRSTFQKERFNPRWKQGTADLIVVVSI